VFDSRFYTSLFLMILLIKLSWISHELLNNEMVIYGEKSDKHKYKDGNFKVYNDYLIQDPSEYGKKDTSSKTNK
jgi:hypothetical protein